MKYAVVGMGVVGKAVDEGCKVPAYVTYDKYKAEGCRNHDCFAMTNICFVCVPTPTNKDGMQDLKALYSALTALDDIQYSGVIVVKCTVLPGTMRALTYAYPSLKLVHNPEFLSTRTAKEEFMNQKEILLSGSRVSCEVVRCFFDEQLAKKPTYSETREYEVTEFAKYIHNGSLAVFLSWLNEVHDVAGERVFRDAVEMVARFGNLPKHTKVPGPDGKPGWGGMCFIKDTLAFLNFGNRGGRFMRMPTLAGAVASNRDRRPEAYR